MAMILLTLVLISSWVALPAGQQKGDGLGEIISDVFSTPPTNNVLTTVRTIPSTKNKNLSDMVSNVFDNMQQAKTSTTYLGTNNKPKPQPENCECVPYYQCNNGTILSSGIGLIDARINSSTGDSVFEAK